MKVIKHKFVPVYNALTDAELTTVTQFVRGAKKLFILTGAGISTESGIPDYRSEGVGLYSRTNHRWQTKKLYQYINILHNSNGDLFAPMQQAYATSRLCQLTNQASDLLGSKLCKLADIQLIPT